METFTLTARDGSTLFCRKWQPEDPENIRAVVQIAHGMAEHSGRYDAFSRALAEKGMAVYANDHRGHGHTAGHEEKLGYFAESNGWDRVVDDMKVLSDRIRDEHPGAPFFVFGHSMGSFLTRDFMARYGDALSGVILSGTAAHPGLLGTMGRMVARTQARIKGTAAPSPLMDKLSFGAYAKAFKPIRTPFDWLSRDTDQVDAYVGDPLCGFICRAGFFSDLISGLAKVNSKHHFAAVAKHLPLFLLSGAMDPVGNYGKGVQTVHDAYKAAGVTDLSLTLYDGGRHEMLNEINRDQVIQDILAWIEGHLA